MLKENVDYTFEDEITRILYEHEVLISFNNDEVAVTFQEWWNVEGKEIFSKYLEK